MRKIDYARQLQEEFLDFGESITLYQAYLIADNKDLNNRLESKLNELIDEVAELRALTIAIHRPTNTDN